MQSYHFGWYTIFVLHKINLIESFKEYLIGSKDFLNFSSLSRYKVNLDYTYLLLGSLLSPNWFVICFRFSFIHICSSLSHSFAHTVISFIRSQSHAHHHLTRLFAFIRSPHSTATSLNGSHSTALTHSYSLNMKILICCIGVY